MSITLRLLAGGMALLLSACGSTPEPAGGSGDSKPLRAITAADVIEYPPQPSTILAAGNTSPYQVAGAEYRVLDSPVGYRERGRASWYGRKFHGLKTANGELFDAYAASAAHRTLPIPGYVSVTNLENARSLVLRVNDRGPFHSGRIIDLSYGAAVRLGFAEQGTAAVEVEYLSIAGTEDLRNNPAVAGWKSDYRYLQVASLSELAAAWRLRDKLSAEVATSVAVREVKVDGNKRYRVQLGPLDDRHQLLALRQELAALGYGQATMLP